MSRNNKKRIWSPALRAAVFADKRMQRQKTRQTKLKQEMKTYDRTKEIH